MPASLRRPASPCTPRYPFLAGLRLILNLLDGELARRTGRNHSRGEFRVAVGSLWGDLLESAVKREAGVKDAARWLPGFGGILDRVDSLLLVLPLVYWAMRLAELGR